MTSPQKATRTRLLLEGPVVPTLLRLAGPNLVVNVVLIAVTTSVDAHFVGRLGSTALAGVSLAFPMLMLMQQMANFSMGGAVASAVARAIGAGRHDQASALVIHAIIIACVMGFLFAGVFLLAGRSIYTFLGAQGPILAAALEYSNAIFAGAVVYWLLSTVTSVLRGTGQVSELAAVYMAAEVLHVLLVPALVFGFGSIPPLGIAGAGIATVASFAASTAVLTWYLASGRTPLAVSLRDVKLEFRLFMEILRVGAPLSFQPIFYNVGLAALTAYAGALGATALTGFGAAVRLEYLLYPLIFGLGAAMPAMVGTNIGAGQFARAVRIAWTAAALSATLTAAVGLFGFFLPHAWTALFTSSPPVQLMAASYLSVVVVAYPFLGLNTLTSAFQAMGQTLWPLVAVASRVLIVVIGGAIALHLDTGLFGLGVVAGAGLMTAGTIIATSFWLTCRRQIKASSIQCKSN